MELLIIDEENNLEIDKIWIKSIPVFNRLITRRKKSEASFVLRDFTLIYLMLNPDSVYINLSENEKLNKCLETLNISIPEFNGDTELNKAIVEYEFILGSLPYKKASDALREGIAKKTEWIRNIDFDKTDKMDRNIFTPDDHTKAIKALASDLTTQDDFTSKFVNAFRTESTRLKTTLTLSHLEQRNTVFKEEAYNL